MQIATELREPIQVSKVRGSIISTGINNLVQDQEPDQALLPEILQPF